LKPIWFTTHLKTFPSLNISCNSMLLIFCIIDPTKYFHDKKFNVLMIIYKFICRSFLQ
jgi:hypothetical protein